MIVIRVFRILDHHAVTVDHINDSRQGPTPPMTVSTTLSYVPTHGIVDDDVDHIKDAVEEAISWADKRAQEAGGWSLIV